jgi:hypothetical protein
MSKLKPDTWDSLPRQSKLAACMYPDKVPEHIQQEMLNRSEGQWRASLQSRIDKGNADAGKVKPTVPDGYYSRVPGLRRK